MSTKKLAVLLILVIVFIIILIFLIDKKFSNPNASSPATAEQISVKPGYFILWDDGMSLSMYVKIINAVEENGSIFLNIEAKNKNNQTYNRKFMIFNKNVNKEFYLKKIEDPKVPFATTASPTVLVDNKSVLNAFRKNKGKEAIVDLPISEAKALKAGLPQTFKPYLNCNDNLYSYLEGSNRLKNCNPISVEISVYENN